MFRYTDINKFKSIEPHLYSSLDNVKGAPYDNKARLYEKLVSYKAYNKIAWGTLPENYKEFAKKAILNSSGISLDMGCGGLIHTADIYASAKQDCILLDNSIEMLKIAKQRIENICGKTPDHLSFLQADAFMLPFDKDSFDSVFSFGVIHVFDRKQDYVNEAMRVLKPGGSFYFTSLTSDRKFSKFYMNLMRKRKEFGEPFTSQQTLELFHSTKTNIESYRIGSMIFMNGTK